MQLLFIDVGGDTYHVAETSGTWKKPGSYCKDELDIAYEELQPDKKGMLKIQVYDCWTADKSNFIIIAPQKVSASVNIICTSTCLFLFETFSL